MKNTLNTPSLLECLLVEATNIDGLFIMIKPNELRIGNYINEQGLILQVGMINNELFKSSEPIPLTEKWLLKFGFENQFDNYLKIYYFNLNEDGVCLFDVDRDIPYGIRVRYVHGLQNLYFSLTGEELVYGN